MTTRIFVCPDCSRLHRDGAYAADLTCDAFPNGIPVEITSGVNDHSEPVDGDGGLIFDPI